MELALLIPQTRSADTDESLEVPPAIVPLMEEVERSLTSKTRAAPTALPCSSSWPDAAQTLGRSRGWRFRSIRKPLTRAKPRPFAGFRARSKADIGSATGFRSKRLIRERNRQFAPGCWSALVQENGKEE